ncbi:MULTISPECIES: carbohydrate ABC transporter permease [unclassified Oceanispirochaeta]|uniref:carbohydrate ABC transporter permease n=1 Tax=unclassified Oceanispirochaeta TaxID=2635722 RepID=UPI0011C073A8|nr:MULTISPECIES: sugar ABC transporter permease [unclassified Oceanispirochaeta]MBF9016554.1 sugar ABC transporter permease [Oceanispirochaeta sp. M2]NPD73016.1 sugar ABC transporter permease [Oceanispirochaeta sp. M1]
MGRGEFIGLKNFIKILSSYSFRKSLSVSAIFMAAVVVFQTTLSLLAAVLVNDETPIIKMCRVLYFLPVVFSFVVVGYLWRGLYNSDYGLINEIISAIGFKKQGFLDSPDQALMSLIITCIWKTWPFFMMILLAGLKEIPPSLYESAEIDGAGKIRQFIALTLPMMKRSILFVLVITTMDSVVKVFVPVFVMTSGGPMGSTDMLVHHIWRTAFRLGKFGEASAMSVILFLFVLIINLLQLKIGENDETT